MSTVIGPYEPVPGDTVAMGYITDLGVEFHWAYELPVTWQLLDSVDDVVRMVNEKFDTWNMSWTVSMKVGAFRVWTVPWVAALGPNGEEWE